MIPRFLRSRWLAVAARVILGLVVAYAGGSKIVDPPGFAHEIFNYRLLPDALVNAMALILPWLEVLCGALLITGVWRRDAARISIVLLAVFIGALSVDLARGIFVECGCFGASARVLSPAERLADMRLAIARDVLLLLLGVIVYFSGGGSRTRVPYGSLR